MRRRLLFAVGCAILFLVAWKLPTTWYDTLPRQPDTPPLPFRGVSLLRLTFFAEALALGWLAVVGWKFHTLEQAELLSPIERPDSPGDLRKNHAMVLLAVVTLVAIVLRSIHLGADLWLDEITPIVDYGHMPVVQVMGSYLRTNNHLLNTLLIKAAIGIFGESEWSVRVPAVIFGVATVPALYWFARLALSRWGSLAAAAFLAVSYHHIFFSQNARGYSAYLFFALVSSGLLIRALADDRAWRWAVYILTIVLGFAALANTAFVFAGHVVIGAIAVSVVRKRGGSGVPLIRRLLTVFAISGFLALQLYATPLPEMYAVITHLYVRQATGFAPFSMEFLREIVRGVTAGFGVIPSILFLLVGVAGLLLLLQVNWLVVAALGLPPAITAAFLLARGLSFSPRFFLLLIPLGIIAALSATESDPRRLLKPTVRSSMRYPRRAALLGALVAMASLLSLTHYYRVPKQSYRAALAYLENTRRPGDKVVVVYAAEGGFRYYAPRIGVRDTTAYEYTRTLSGFDSLASALQNVRVVTTFPRALRADMPDIAARIESYWTPTRVFPATVGDGEITIWTRKVPCAGANCRL
jgi:mannosyltransferase